MLYIMNIYSSMYVYIFLFCLSYKPKTKHFAPFFVLFSISFPKMQWGKGGQYICLRTCSPSLDLKCVFVQSTTAIPRPAESEAVGPVAPATCPPPPEVRHEVTVIGENTSSSVYFLLFKGPASWDWDWILMILLSRARLEEESRIVLKTTSFFWDFYFKFLVLQRYCEKAAPFVY